MPVWILGTGEEIPKEAKHYIGTIVTKSYVWHVFTEKQEHIDLNSENNIISEV
jgi:hypothetical protein